jgi:DNA replication and repair protein RecF
MYLEWLQIGHVRILDQVRIEPGPRLNIFAGPNACGKTAFLESIHLLARARSFRTPRIQEVVRKGEETLQISARAGYRGSDQRVITGIEKGRGQVAIRYAGTPVRTVSEQARNLPLVLATPDSHILVTGTPKQRRHWLDWAMFHVEPTYLEHWRDYVRALRHRNSLLKEGVRDSGLFQIWEKTMARAGEAMAQARKGFIQELGLQLNEVAASRFPYEISVDITRGWPADTGLEECLARSRAGDRAAGFTRYGPHRADILFGCNGESLAARFSRGQIKLFVCLLMLAEGAVVEKLSDEPPVFLLDDYAAELDARASEYLLNRVMERGWQAFVTTTEFREPDRFPGQKRVFHVEHGEIAKVVE